MAYFPMYIDITEKKCLVVGGGAVARRKAAMLKEFGAHVTVVAPNIDKTIVDMPGVKCLEKEFEETDLDGCRIVIAATDSKKVNHKIAELCKTRGISINAVDQIDDCGFIFPSVVKRGDVIASFSSGGKSPAVTQLLKREMEKIMTQDVETAADFLGRLRPRIKREVKFAANRRVIYEELLALCIQQHREPAQGEVEKIIVKYNNR